MRDKVIEGISDLRDESDRHGMRIVIELRRGEVPEVVLNNLYKHTALQTSFGVIMLGHRRRPAAGALAARPSSSTFSSSGARWCVAGRSTSCARPRRARTSSRASRLRSTISTRSIALIRAAPSPPAARAGLIERFELTPKQAQAILDMQLQRLTGLERQKIVDELAELRETIARLRAILESAELLRGIVVDELRAIAERYGDERRTEIIHDPGDFSVEGPDRRGGHGDHGQQHRLHQAHGRHRVPCSRGAGGKGPHRNAHARGGLPHPRLRRVDARLHPHLLGPRARSTP